MLITELYKKLTNLLENQRFKLLVIEVPVISEIFPPLRITMNKTSRKSEVNFIRDQFATRTSGNDRGIKNYCAITA